MSTPEPARRWFPDKRFYTEEKCTRCGVCCGSTDGDRCESLERDGDLWICRNYAERLGPRHTVNGHPFDCVPIKRVIENMGGYASCAYVQEIRRIREERGEPTDDLGRMETPLG